MRIHFDLRLGQVSLKQPWRRHRQFSHPYTDRMIDSISSGGRWRHDADFADATNPQRMERIRDFDDHGFDHRHIEAGRHPIIEEAKIAQTAFAVVDILFVNRPSEALRGATLHLTLDISWMIARPASCAIVARSS